jgi:hypothetical protein
MNRREKLDKLFEISPSIGADFDVPDAPSRFAVLEQDSDGNTLWMYLSSNLDALRDIIASSETHFVERIRIHDLDADTVLTPVWRIERFETLEDGFSYENGYSTIE